MARNLITVKVGFIQTTKLVYYIMEGYYGDDRPRKRGLNEIEGDYYDYIEMDDTTPCKKSFMLSNFSDKVLVLLSPAPQAKLLPNSYHDN